MVRTHGHIFREHHEEADHLANLGTEGKTKIAMEGVKNTEEWKNLYGVSRMVTKKKRRWKKLVWNCGSGSQLAKFPYR